MAAADSATVVDAAPAPEVPEEIPAEEISVKPQRGRKAKAASVKKAEAPKEKKVKEVKAKEPKVPKVPKAKTPASHPTYLLMATEAIAALKERTGSSQYAIAKYLEDKYKTGLPPNFKKMLTTQLRNLTKAGKLVKVKNSFKLSDELKKPPKAAKPVSLPKASVKVAPKAKVVKKPAASRVKSKTARVGATKTKVSGAKATKATKPEVMATNAAKLKRPIKVSGASPKKATTKVSAPVRKTETAKKAVTAKKAPAAVETKKPVSGRKPPTVRKTSTPKKAPKSVKGPSAKAVKPVAKSKTADRKSVV